MVREANFPTIDDSASEISVLPDSLYRPAWEEMVYSFLFQILFKANRNLSIIRP